MSQTNHDAPNAGHDGDSGSDSETITDLTEAQAHFKNLEERRETRRFDVSDDPDESKYVTFTVRALKEGEREKVESIAASEHSKSEQRTRTGQEGEMNIWPVKKTQLQYGIVDSSLADFNPDREDHLKSLPTAIKDELFTAIDELGDVSSEVVDGFQSVG